MELPEELKWMSEVEGIDPSEGITNCGMPQQYVKFVKTFFDTLEARIAEIKNALDGGDMQSYTIKVHSLKSTARILGAKELSEMAEELEKAGDEGDREKITMKTPGLLAMCGSFKDKLSPIEHIGESGSDTDNEKPAISASDLENAYKAIAEFVPQMDYDAVEMVIAELKEYRLPPMDLEKVKKIEKLLRNFDWDKIQALVVVK